MDTKSRIGIQIKSRREEVGLSQAMLAEATGRSIEAISLIERGKTLPGIDTLELLTEALGISLKDVFGFAPSRRTRKGESLIAQIDAVLADCTDQELATVLDVVKALRKNG